VYLQPHQKLKVSRQLREVHSLKKSVNWKAAVDETRLCGESTVKVIADANVSCLIWFI